MIVPYPGTVQQRGSTDPSVKFIQARLGVEQTGLFGPTTEACVTAFQRSRGLDADGQVGPKTWKALFTDGEPTAPSSIGRAALEEAISHVGVEETPRGSNRGARIDAWNERAGVPRGSFWCMSFVFAMVDDACKRRGVPNRMLQTASCSALYRWAKKHGKIVSRPERGDIFLCIGGERGHYHTGFVRQLLPNERFSTVEGNSNDDGSANGYEVAYRPNGRSLSSCHYVRL